MPSYIPEASDKVDTEGINKFETAAHDTAVAQQDVTYGLHVRARPQVGAGPGGTRAGSPPSREGREVARCVSERHGACRDRLGCTMQLEAQGLCRDGRVFFSALQLPEPAAAPTRPELRRRRAPRSGGSSRSSSRRRCLPTGRPPSSSELGYPGIPSSLLCCPADQRLLPLLLPSVPPLLLLGLLPQPPCRRSCLASGWGRLAHFRVRAAAELSTPAFHLQGGPGWAASRGRPGRICRHACGPVWHGAAAVRRASAPCCRARPLGSVLRRARGLRCTAALPRSRTAGYGRLAGLGAPGKLAPAVLGSLLPAARCPATEPDWHAAAACAAWAAAAWGGPRARR